MIHSRTHENAIGTKPPRCGAGHGGADPELPRLITGGTHHPALGRGRADDHRPAAQPRVVPLLHGSEKRIHIKMEDYAECRRALPYETSGAAAKMTVAKTGRLTRTD